MMDLVNSKSLEYVPCTNVMRIGGDTYHMYINMYDEIYFSRHDFSIGHSALFPVSPPPPPHTHTHTHNHTQLTFEPARMCTHDCAHGERAWE